MRYGVYRYRTFSEIIPTLDDFVKMYKGEHEEYPRANKYPQTLPASGDIYGADATTVYYLLLSRFSESPIASLSEEMFINKLFATIFEHGGVWKKKLEMQNKLLNLSDDEIIKGGKAFYNHANNPSTAPVNDSTQALPKIDDQNVTSYIKSKMEGYSILTELLDSNVTREFIDKFKPLFNTLVMPDYELHYIEEV